MTLHVPACAPDGCADRRTFLQTVGCLGFSFALLGLTSREVRALPVFAMEATQSGTERRYQMPAVDSVNIDRAAQLIVVRAAGHAYVFALSCPHENNAVKWVEKAHRFQCTKHDSQYQVDGVHTAGRATRNLDRYMIRRDGEAIVVDLHRWVRSDTNPADWAAAMIAL